MADEKTNARTRRALVRQHRETSIAAPHVPARAILSNSIAIADTRSVQETSSSLRKLLEQTKGAFGALLSYPSFTRQLKKLRCQSWTGTRILVFEEQKRLFPILIPNAADPICKVLL